MDYDSFLELVKNRRSIRLEGVTIPHRIYDSPKYPACIAGQCRKPHRSEVAPAYLEYRPAAERLPKVRPGL